jgi:hypothetical protein
MRANLGGAMSRASAAVVDLADARDGRRLRELRLRLCASLDRNKRALGRLFQSGVLYTRAGARLGRELLLAHQHLLKAGDLLARLDEGAGREDAEVGDLERQVLAVLERTGELNVRSDGLLAREP